MRTGKKPDQRNESGKEIHLIHTASILLVACAKRNGQNDSTYLGIGAPTWIARVAKPSIGFLRVKGPGGGTVSAVGIDIVCNHSSDACGGNTVHDLAFIKDRGGVHDCWRYSALVGRAGA